MTLIDPGILSPVEEIPWRVIVIVTSKPDGSRQLIGLLLAYAYTLSPPFSPRGSSEMNRPRFWLQVSISRVNEIRRTEVLQPCVLQLTRVRARVSRIPIRIVSVSVNVVPDVPVWAMTLPMPSVEILAAELPARAKTSSRPTP